MQETVRGDGVMPAESASTPFQSGSSFVPEDLHWAPPAGWTVNPPGGMRLVSMESPGGGDFSVIILPDSPDLANVNRWLEQIGRPAVSADILQQMRETIQTAIGSFHVYQLEGLEADSISILAAIYRRGSHAVFFRLQGTRETIREQRPYFDGFLRGFHFAVDHDTGILETGPDTTGYTAPSPEIAPRAPTPGY